MTTKTTDSQPYTLKGIMRVSSVTHTAAYLLLFCLAPISLSIVEAYPLFAQRGPVQRIVQGKVTDKGEAGIGGAVVYLKDGHSLAVKSFISEADGGYRFGQLSDGTDYELWAESNGKKSGTKSISSFDTKTSFQINLKIDTSK